MIATVPVKTSWFSKINWTQAIAFLAMIVAYFGIDVSPEVQAAILAVITGVSTIITWIIRTWFTKAMTTASVT